MIEGLIIFGIIVVFLPLIILLICFTCEVIGDTQETLSKKRKVRWLEKNGFMYGYIETSETTGRKFYGWKNLIDGRFILEWKLDKLSYKEMVERYAYQVKT